VTRLIIADAHVGHGGSDAAEMAGLVGRAADAGFGELIYLGDAFQYLIGMSKFWTPAVRRVLAEWDRARRRGVRVALIEGNRDFFLDEPELAAHVDWTGRRYQFDAGERSYRVVHGDRVNLRDVQYRFWSAVSKSRPARIWARLLPASLAVAIVNHMEARLAATNRKYRYRKPIRDLERSASKAWAEGVDVLLWGHFHTVWSCREADRFALVVPAWMETRGCLAVANDGSWSWRGAALEPQPLPAALTTEPCRP
jgi:UDP-2,3-diacylglucosamine pyrophosphatase LpxH